MKNLDFNNKGYEPVSTKDGRWRMFVPTPRPNGCMMCNCMFSLANRLPMVDAIDTLGYITVSEVCQIDSEYSVLGLRCHTLSNEECMRRLIEELPKIMEDYLN